jgi:phosphate starvation-inducible PhoH-like protein
VRKQIELDNAVAAEMAGSGDAILRTLEGHLDCDVYLRGNILTLDGDPDAVSAAEEVVGEMTELIAQGHEISAGTVEAVSRALDEHEKPAQILEDVVWRHRSLKVAPKTVHQKRYVDSIRRNTITFGIGPAGTGKTFLAVALAAGALSRREVNRIILTRPAVEAGERLGFLPGDLMAKVDPYLRPLFDALHDMLEPERVSQYLEKGVIEVAPLAFMRGRAQPLHTPVLTPNGFRPIGSLQVGDLVVGSNGQPTPVIGVYPQGRKPVHRLTTQDGASTLCCSEHLWHVYTASDRRQGKLGRVLETQQMRGQLSRERFELPLLSAPAEFPAREVPLDPYAVGRALAGSAPRTLAMALASAKYQRQGSIATLADPPPASIHRYLENSVAVRCELLQGLLDSEAAAVGGSSGGLGFRPPSGALRDDVAWLVRSLGGTATQRGGVLDIRLPHGVAPFRLTRKRELYEQFGGGRPMRFVDSIEPVGEMETVCIQVAAADSLYVTEDFLVTHNTLNDSFIILDEAQNTSPEQMKMFLTRLGFNSKIVVTGDVTQVDLPRDQASGLIAVTDILEGVEDIEFIQFGQEDVVRHKLVRRIVAAYDEAGQRMAADLRPRKAG